MFKFFCYLKDRTPHAPLSPEEKKIISGKIKLSSDKLAEIMRCQDAHQLSLQNAFLWQQEKARVSSVSLMQSFSSHHCLGTLGPGKVQTTVNKVDHHIRSTIWRGWETWASRAPQLHPLIPIITQHPQPLHNQAPCHEDGCWRHSRNGGFICSMLTHYWCIAVLIRNQKINTKVAISLNGWTSSNNYGFLAIVAHYVYPVTGGLGMFLHIVFIVLFPWLPTEENLIDFHELLGQHTGENIADAVWDMLGTFGIQEKVRSLYFSQRQSP